MLEHFLILLISAAQFAQGMSTFCNDQNYFCVTGWTDKSTSCFTITSKRLGWAGLGIGSSGMAGSDMYVGWKNSTQGYTIANLQGVGKVKPNPASVQNAYQSLPLNSSATPSSGIYFSFCLIDGKSVIANQRYVYAYSNGAPESPDSISAPFQIHDFSGSFTADFTGPSSTLSNAPVAEGSSQSPIIGTSNYIQIVLIHGVFMWMAWILFSIPAVFVARFLREKLGAAWFPVHRGLMFFGCGLFSMIGLIVIILFKRPPHFSSSSHEKLGLSIIVLMVAELILGWAIDKLYDAQRDGPPLHDQIHWWMGRLLLLLSIINVQLGFSQFQESFPGELNAGLVAGNWILIGLYIGAFLYAQFFWSGYTSAGTHIPISAAASIAPQ